MRSFLVVIALFITTAAAIAGDHRREIIIQGASFPSSIVLLVDRSASMRDNDKYNIAVRNAMAVIRQAGDDGRVKLAIFSSGTIWWTPPVDSKPINGWLRLPDADGVAAAEKWLRSYAPSGNTYMADAAEEALSLPDSSIGIIIITDEDATGGVGPTCKHILDANNARSEPAIIGVIGVEPEQGDRVLGTRLASGTGGTHIALIRKEHPISPTPSAVPK